MSDFRQWDNNPPLCCKFNLWVQMKQLVRELIFGGTPWNQPADSMVKLCSGVAPFVA
jgi:hypothetical protein